MQLLFRHGLKIWAGQLLGFLVSFAIMAFFVSVTGLVLFVAGAFSFLESFNMFGLSSLETEMDFEMLDTWSLGEELLLPFASGMEGLFALIVVFSLFLFVVGILLFAFMNGGAIGMTMEAIRSDQSTIGAYFRHGFRKLLPMFGQQLLVALIIFVPMSIFAGLGGGLIMTGPLGMVFGGLVLFAGILAFFALILLLLHAPVALIADERKIMDSISHSFRVCRQHLGQVLLTALIVFLVSVVGGLIVYRLSSWISGDVNHSNLYRQFLGDIFTFALFSALGVVNLIAIVYRYVDVINPLAGNPSPLAWNQVPAAAAAEQPLQEMRVVTSDAPMPEAKGSTVASAGFAGDDAAMPSPIEETAASRVPEERGEETALPETETGGLPGDKQKTDGGRNRDME